MTLPGSTHAIVSLAIDRMVYCLVAGTALVAIVSLGLRLIPQKNSQTRFVVWFSALLAIVTLPFLGAQWRPHLADLTPHNALVIVPESLALGILCGWAVLAGAGVIRLIAGLWQVRRLRLGCTEIDPRLLGSELQRMVDECKRSRPVSILISPRIEVPTAIGFLRPAVVIPAWLAEEMTPQDLQYVILHELAHLRRRDDWTNLAQKLVKALLFFHPGVFWIERKLSISREMACDDAVLAQAASARVYALCLARVAEKGLAHRRQMILAQAAVDRVRQLSLRVAEILNEDRPRGACLWKPAIPMVTAATLLCALAASQAPQLVGLGEARRPASSASTLASPVQPKGPDGLAGLAGSSKTAGSPSSVVPASYTPRSTPRPRLITQRRPKPSPAPIQAGQRASQAGLTRLAAMHEAIFDDNAQAPATSPASDDRGALLVVVMTSTQVNSPGSRVWQVQTLELRWIVPEPHTAKQIPRKM